MNPTIRFSIRNPHSETRDENIHAAQKALSVASKGGRSLIMMATWIGLKPMIR
jgi:hypothetical protein